MAESIRIVLGVTASVSVELTSGIAERMSDRGWDVHLVSAPGVELERVGACGNVRVHALSMRRNPAPLADARALVGWVRLLQRLRPDAVMVGTPKAGLLGTVAGALTRVPVRIYLLRGLRLETTKGAQRRLLGTIERITFAAATTAVAVSASLRAQVLSLGLVKAPRVVVLGAGSSNGVDATRFRRLGSDNATALTRSELGLVPGVPVIGFVGRLHADKGVHVLVEASRELRRRDVQHQFLVVGGTEEVEAERALASLRGIAEAVITVGEVEDSAPYFRLMDVFCLPTFREGFPNVVLEASASGLPVVTTDATGAVDSVVPGVTGYIARAGDEKSLADALQALLLDARSGEAMGRAGRQRALEAFDQDLVWSTMMDYVSSVVAASRARESARRRGGSTMVAGSDG